MKGSEDFQLLQDALEPVLNEVNQVVATGKVRVGDGEVTLEFFLGSDYKV